MSDVPAGWYPDPTAPPTNPPHLRYWDGASWTEHAAAPPAQAQPAYGGSQPTTPDGVPLSGWWRRVLAYLIDGFLLAIPAVLVVLPDISRLVHLLSDQVDRASTGTQSGAFSAEYNDALHSMSLHQLPVAILSLAYFALMLRWKGATLGQLAVGLRVRLRDQPGRLPWRAILLRVLVLNGIGLVSSVLSAVGWEAVASPVGMVISLFILVDVLWPLWDGKRQALHDKVARTNVVKVR